MSPAVALALAHLKPEPHPVAVWLRPERLEQLVTTDAGKAELWQFHQERAAFIAAERENPFENLVEPPIWLVCDALLGLPWVDAAAARRGWGADWSRRMRAHLGFPKPVDTLLICGCNRGGKSQYAARTQMRILRGGPNRVCWAYHETLDLGVQEQQPLFFRYLPPELRKKNVKTRTLYVTYNQKTGFGESNFVLETGSRQVFKAYGMGVEGANLDSVWCDELAPADEVKTLKFRIAQKRGKMLVTFTPVEGYNDTVAMFCDGAEVRRESTAFLLPRDGGAPDVARQLGLTAEELAEWRASVGDVADDDGAEKQARPSWAPASRPEDCHAWLTGGTGQMEVPEGREFERVPRVLKPAGEGKSAVVFFHLGDNPYGNPLGVWEMANG